MKCQLNPDELAIVLDGCRQPQNASDSIPKLVEGFQPIIQKIASTYPYFWEDDFIQEGTLGLLNAARKFPSDANPREFIYYATTAIRSRMVNFYHSVLVRVPECVELICNRNFNEGEETEEIPFETPHDLNHTENESTKIDFKYHLSTERLTRNGFSEKEIDAFNLHFLQGFGTGEVAKQLGVSDSRASKIISKARTKVQVILKDFQVSNSIKSFNNN